MSTLALLGGKPVREKLFPAYLPLGDEERHAVNKVMESGVLSQFLGAWHEDFFGGPEVRAFEQEWAEAFDAKHAITVNSATSGLYAAIGAAGVGPGDEVIVTPYTMIASATSVLIFNGIPVFADIDPNTFTLDPKSIEARITERTKAIVVVHIFGQAADMDPIMDIARKHNLIVIEDCAQIPFGTYKGRPMGTIGDMGVFSLNYHKHIHTGEGGIVVTNDDDLAESVQLIRNHGEGVVRAKGHANLINMVGFNFRLGEIECAIGRCQLKKGPDLIRQRQENVRYLESKISGLPGLTMPVVSEGNSHVYYVHAIRYDANITGVPRATYVAAIRAELPETILREGAGALIGAGYVPPLYLEPIFQKQIAYGDKGCPFTCPMYEGQVNYEKGICPVCEDLHYDTLIVHEMMRPGMSKSDLDDVAAAFIKVSENLSALKIHHEKTGD